MQVNYGFYLCSMYPKQQSKSLRVKSYKAPSPPRGNIIHPVYARCSTYLVNESEIRSSTKSDRYANHISRSTSARTSLTAKISNFIRRSERTLSQSPNSSNRDQRRHLEKRNSCSWKGSKSNHDEIHHTRSNSARPVQCSKETLSSVKAKANTLTQVKGRTADSRKPTSVPGTACGIPNGEQSCSFVKKGSLKETNENLKGNREKHSQHWPVGNFGTAHVGKIFKLLRPQTSRENFCLSSAGTVASSCDPLSREFPTKENNQKKGNCIRSDCEFAPVNNTKSQNEKLHTQDHEQRKNPQICSRRFGKCTVQGSVKKASAPVRPVQAECEIKDENSKSFSSAKIAFEQPTLNKVIQNCESKAKACIDEILELTEKEIKSTVVVVPPKSHGFSNSVRYRSARERNSTQPSESTKPSEPLSGTGAGISSEKQFSSRKSDGNASEPSTQEGSATCDSAQSGLAVVFITTDNSAIKRIKDSTAAFTSGGETKIGCSIITVISSDGHCSTEKTETKEIRSSTNDTRGKNSKEDVHYLPVSYNNCTSEVSVNNNKANRLSSRESAPRYISVNNSDNFNKRVQQKLDHNSAKSTSLVECDSSASLSSSATLKTKSPDSAERQTKWQYSRNSIRTASYLSDSLGTGTLFTNSDKQLNSTETNSIATECKQNCEIVPIPQIRSGSCKRNNPRNSPIENSVSFKDLSQRDKNFTRTEGKTVKNEALGEPDITVSCRGGDHNNNYDCHYKTEFKHTPVTQTGATSLKDTGNITSAKGKRRDTVANKLREEQNYIDSSVRKATTLNIQKQESENLLPKHGERTFVGRETGKLNQLCSSNSHNEVLDFGECLPSTATSESSSENITECYNVKLDAPEEVIVAGFHDFCHTMLSLEDSSLEPYDTGTIKRKPVAAENVNSTGQDKRNMNQRNRDKEGNSSGRAEESTQSCTLPERSSRGSIRNIDPKPSDHNTDKLLEEIQRSKLIEKDQDVKDADVLEAIRALDSSLIEAQNAPESIESNISHCDNHQILDPEKSSVTLEIKNHQRGPRDDKIQCDNLIEELMLENMSKTVLNSNMDKTDASNSCSSIAVTISTATASDAMCITSPQDRRKRGMSCEERSVSDFFIGNPKESILEFKGEGHSQGEVICTFTTQPGPLRGCSSPSNSIEALSISSTTGEEMRRINLTSDSKDEEVSLPEPVHFSPEEKNRESLVTSSLQVSLDNSPMSHSAQDVVACHRTSPCSVDSGTSSHNQGYFVVVAIDFGTTYSGYAFSFTRDPDNIHMMKKWDGGDPGVFNQKTPTTLLLTPEGNFHSFGYSARDFYHDLDAEEAKRWLYFDKFKMTLHHSEHLSLKTEISAANGKPLAAVDIFAHALGYFKEHALQELSDQSATKVLNEDVRWVVTVPAIWKQPAKQFMRAAAYKAGIASPEFSDQLLIALEPEAASIYCRRMRLHQLVPNEAHAQKSPFKWQNESNEAQSEQTANDQDTGSPNAHNQHGDSSFGVGTRYMVVDCGGGTVDITVHEILDKHGTLKELQKASGGPYGSIGVDMEFEKLLCDIFGTDFIQQFKTKRPTGYVDLMVAFEARKRNASPYKNNPLNISLPFSFIDYFKKYKGSSVETTLKKSVHKDVKWSSQGMLRLEPSAMERLFHNTVKQIREHIEKIVSLPELNIDHLFLVGGFAESLILQKEIKDAFSSRLKVIIPQGVSLAILKGAVLFGLDPTIVNIRRLRMTYGVGVLNRFIHGVHPKEKLVVKDGIEWCADIFDKFVVTDQSVGLGDVVVRSYTPAKAGQSCSVIHIYCSEKDNVYFITDKGVKRCATLILDLSDSRYVQSREIQTRMMFGDTEIRVSALDVTTGKCVKSEINFLSH